MESYGIAVTSLALPIVFNHQIIGGDSHYDHALAEVQAEPLVRGRVALMQLLAVLYEMP